jgi:glycosyltransferase involved in cell wall biosynthesis
MKVSVLMITYNHEDFIAEAVESVLMQDVDFEYELVIGEDCSTDKTREILIGLKEKYPGIIKLLPTMANLGSSKNFLRTLYACRGEYIAFLEGDDLWISPDKLTKQVDFLDKHPECSICFHDVYEMEGGTRSSIGYCERKIVDKRDIYTIVDLIDQYFIPTCGTMIRSGLVNEYPKWAEKLLMIARTVNFINAQYGDIGFINEKLGVYRKHSGGVWTSLSWVGRIQATILFFHKIDTYLDYQYSDKIKAVISSQWDGLAKALEEYGVFLGQENVSIKQISKVFNDWPGDLLIDKEWSNQLLGKIYQRLLFDTYLRGELSKTRYCFARLIQHDPSHLRSRGVVSIGMQSLAGQRTTRFIKRRRGRHTVHD